MPSVSVVKDLRVDPEKEEALQGWRERFDGKSQWGQPWWKDQQMFKAYRGTLIHFAILSALDDSDSMGETYFHEVGDDEWGYEEYYAEYCLRKWSKKAPSANTDEVPCSPRQNQYDGEHAWDRTVRDMQWATRTFKQAIIDGTVPSSVDVHEDSAPIDGRLYPAGVLAVEEYVYDQEYGYGGQYDLLYETPDGETVLADVKTSSGVRFGNKLQLAAYKRAIETGEDGPKDIDEVEVLRLYPDKEVVEVSRSSQWDRSLWGLECEFLGLADQARVEYSEALELARQQLCESDHEGTHEGHSQSELPDAADD